jgi:hypothetical protein
MHARSFFLPVLIGLVIAAAPVRALAEDAPVKPPRVGIVIELAVNVEPDRADSIALALADALNRELHVDAFGGGDVTRQLPASGLPEECLARAECIADVSERLDAEQLIFLVLVQVGQDTQVDSSWVDVASGKVSSRPRVLLPTDASSVSVFAAQAQRYLPDARPRKTETIVVREGGGAILGPTTTPRKMTLPAWITAGTAGVALTAGAILGLSARKTYQRCDMVAGGCSDSELDGLERRALFADISFGVAAGAAVATVVLYLRSGGDPIEAQPAPVQVTPTTGGAMIGLTGRW